MRKLLAYIALVLLPMAVDAQEPDSLRLIIRDSILTVLHDTLLTVSHQDTTGTAIHPDSISAATRHDAPPLTGKQKRTRSGPSPTGSPVVGQDTAFISGTRQWTLSPDFTTEIAVPLDTAFSLFNRYRVADKISDFNAYNGNYGLPQYEINFFDREWNPDRFLYFHCLPFMFTPANTLFINTHVPFTELRWSNGGARSKAEQTFRIRHSQNVNRFINFGLVYDIVYNVGQYTLQRAIDKNFLLHASYNSNPYTAYFSAGINNHESAESGGMVSPDQLSEYAPDGVPFKLNALNNAKSTLQNRYLMIVQRYAPGGRRDTVTGMLSSSGPITFSHIGILEWNTRHYLDNYPESSLYDTVMIDDGETADSLRQRTLSNTLRVDFAAGRTERFRIGAGAGVRSELRAFGYIMPGDTLTRPDTLRKSTNSLVLTGKVFNNIGSKFGWSASGDLWFQGYRAGDFIFNGRIYKEFDTGRKGLITWDATGTIASCTPSFWYGTWGSNNFSWQLDLKREFRLMAGSSLLWPDLKMSLKFNYAIVDNFTHFGPDAVPSQHEGGLSLLALTAKKEFVVWKLHLDNTVLLQQSTNTDVLDLPLITARSAFFFDHLFKFKATSGELYFQLGAEAMIHTPYHAMNYMPATGRYYNQAESEIGNYPFINAFLNLKVKRTRFFIMADHVNSGLTGYGYFLVPGYPLNIRMIKYGLAWTFYD
ncbi:MAG: putative porin [Bacteroidales bacterium]